MKYKIGDKVRITDNKELLEKVGLEPNNLENEYVGEIVDVDEECNYLYRIENDSWYWNFNDEQIIGLVEDDKPIETSRASLNYESEYYHVVEQLHKAELLNRVLLDYIELKDI